MKDCIIVIPARMSSARLPGKPLIDIAGLPMIHHVWNRAISVLNSEDVIIATEDKEIEDYCLSNNLNCMLTNRTFTGEEKVKLVSDKILAKTYMCVLGDEPLINTNDLKTIRNAARLYPDIVLMGRKMIDESDFYDHSKAKIVFDLNDRLLYASRAGFPLTPKGKFDKAYKAIWLYSFSKTTLDEYFNSPPTPLEKIESLGILRFLELGIEVKCIDLIGDSWAVDEPKDIKIVENRLQNLH